VIGRPRKTSSPASALWTPPIRFIGAGFLAVPILTGSGAYALSEAFGWNYGLHRNPARPKEFYAVIVIATVIGILINFIGINPIDALDGRHQRDLSRRHCMVLIMLIANNRAVMQERTNGLAVNILGRHATALLFVAAIALA